MSSNNKRVAQKDEHLAWQFVCKALLETGAVTEVDLKSSVSKRETQGQRLLCALREWGSERENLGRFVGVREALAALEVE